MQTRLPITRKMVAEEAGVSVTIVSYVINNNRYVDKEKRRRVQEAIKKLGYRPNAVARSLKFKKSNHLLFVADQIDNEHFGKLISEMDSLLYDQGYFISLAHNRNDDEFIQHTISRQFDGVAISSISMKERHIRAITEAGIPVVLMMNRNYQNLPAGVGKVYPGLYEGARQCVRHLGECGRRHILYIDRFSQRGNFSDMTDLRLKGYMDEMAALDLPVVDENVISQCATEEEVMERISRRLRSGGPVDAVFARNDRLAAVAIRAVRAADLAIPGDVAIVGFDNSNLSRYTHPSLTTMEIDRKGVAGALVSVMRMMLEGKPAEPVALSTSLIVRESTAGIA